MKRIPTLLRSVSAPIARVALSALVLVTAGCSEAEPPAALPRLTIDPQRIAVAGFSSGAIMAQQMHFAYSDRLRGAMLLSGPPYQCARGSLDVALSRCMKSDVPALDVEGLSASIVERASSGALAPLAGLDGDRVLALHGTHDALVPESIARASLEVYERLPNAGAMSLRWEGDAAFAHVWPTLAQGGDCATTASPYIGRCARDLAGEAMRALYDEPLRDAATEAAAAPMAFAQSGPAGEDAFLGETGYLYRPPQCTDTHSCGLLVVFHGCEQQGDEIGDRFARESGFNRWADAYDVVVLYPQTRATYMPLNPKACWDWWGYSGSDYDTREGVQLRAIAAMAAALGAPLSD